VNSFAVAVVAEEQTETRETYHLGWTCFFHDIDDDDDDEDDDACVFNNFNMPT